MASFRLRDKLDFVSHSLEINIFRHPAVKFTDRLDDVKTKDSLSSRGLKSLLLGDEKSSGQHHFNSTATNK